MDKNFLLDTETARHLYHDYAADLPLVDYHCHISPREICEDRRFRDLAEVWLGGRDTQGVCVGDHYKWRLMRANGVAEDYITGTQPGYARFLKFVEALELAIGNPMYHWCHLELRQFFGITEPLTTESAPRIWEICGRKLRENPSMSVRGLIRRAGVVFIGTTDDPVDTLEWHEKLAREENLGFRVCPSFRPDKALNLTAPGFAAYMTQLAASVGKTSLDTVEAVCDALVTRLEFFHSLGCRASDHGLLSIPFRPCAPAEANQAYRKALAGEPLTPAEVEGYQTALLLHLGRAYHRKNIVMQFHYSCLRNTNARRYGELGPDTGFDAIAQTACVSSISQLLSALDETGECPQVILYSLNPADNAQLDALAGCFQDSSMPGKIQHGSAWWFNDTRSGIEDQLRSLANQSLLGNFVGMLTDSRSFLSYARHDYFRRILCNLLGTWVESGEYPNRDSALKTLVEAVSYRNAVRYFHLDH